jgi:prepilin-type N-terminal cleavage/methylation domain-containing protein
VRFPEPAAGRGGFTLLEVMVSIAISAVLLLGARALVEQVGHDAERISGTAAEVDREANAERLLRAVVGRAEQPGPGREFVGTPAGARFPTWCDVPAGWQERCSVTLGVLRVGSSNVLALELPGGEIIAVRRGFAEGRLLYLRDAGEGGAWQREWSSSVSTPLALGVEMDGDTVILRVGERG